MTAPDYMSGAGSLLCHDWSHLMLLVCEQQAAPAQAGETTFLS